MLKSFVSLAALAASAPAFADTHIAPIVDARLRYENVSQAATTPALRDAEALTLRVRAGVEGKAGDFAALIEAEGTLALIENYNSTTNGRSAFAVVPDPQNIELNRAQIQYRGLPKTVITLGRQRIALDDQRFVGSVGWRQNEQTFDAARIEWSGIKNLKADVSYAWNVRTIWGVDGTGSRPSGISGGNVFANLSYKIPVGTLTGFGYLVDQDEALVQGFRQSSQTYGGRAVLGVPLSKAVKLGGVASYARQSDYGRNPNRYSADYWNGELLLALQGFTLTGGYEQLGASSGAALTSFQTPLATLHKFNGWADKFLTTPPNGLQDSYASIGYAKTKVGPFDAISALAAYHDYRADRSSGRYGSEINLQLSAKIKRTSFLLKYADYSADGFATDTRKFWASIEWAL